MLLHRCTLENNRIIVPVSVSKPDFVNGQLAANPMMHSHYRALLDTGAQRTVLTRKVIGEQQLPRIGHMEIAGVHGPKTHSKFLAFLGIWANREHSNATQIGQELTLFQIDEPFEPVNMDNNENFDLILGFDVLKRFSFSFDGLTKEFCIIVSN